MRSFFKNFLTSAKKLKSGYYIPTRAKMTSPIAFNSLSVEDKKKFLNSFDVVLTDCDGVVWIGGQAVDGAVEVMNTFQRMGKKAYFITNNSTQTRTEFLQKCSRLGFKAEEDNIVSTAWLSAHYLKSKGFNKKVYLIGPKSVHKELANVGIDCIGVGPDPAVGTKAYNPAEFKRDELDPEVGAVIVGYDVHFSLPKIIRACNYLDDPGCIFIGTNTDERFPNRNNLVWPGTGTFVIAIETAAQRKSVIMGKPSTYIIDAILKERGVDPKRALMIGDRCNTDIHFGTRSGMTTLLVLTGVTNLQELNEFEQSGQTHLLPTYYTDSIADILSVFQA